jgi:catechol 2,3-dioxygenase-like lactoylglutathione lyase family enzyme
MNLNQVTMPAVDVASAVAFYRRLGLRLIVEDLPHYARFECPDGESTLSVEQVSEGAAGHGPVVYFECEDLDQTVGRLRSAGIPFESPPADNHGYGGRPGSGIPAAMLCACIGPARIAAIRHGAWSKRQALCEVFAKNGVRTCCTFLLLHLGQ